jgi:hypothetical protein
LDKRTATNDTNKSDKDKKPNDRVMDNIWKMMKYTQGENDQNKTMKLYMPVFIHIETLSSAEKSEDDKKKENGEEDVEVEVKLLITLPPEYQFDSKDPNKSLLEPPVPTDPSITFEVIEEFKCYVRYKFNEH